MKATTLIAVCVSILLSGCYGLGPVVDHQANIIKLNAVGYGAVNSYASHTEGQKKLMAMRASKLDAYRALAEQVRGVRLTGTSTVSSMIAQNDSFRVYIDAYIRGARVLSVNQIADGNYETTIEMDFDENLVRNYAAGLVGHPAYGMRGTVGPGTGYGSYYRAAPVYAPYGNFGHYGVYAPNGYYGQYGPTFYYSSEY
jgi:hypothetical protein